MGSAQDFVKKNYKPVSGIREAMSGLGDKYDKIFKKKGESIWQKLWKKIVALILN